MGGAYYIHFALSLPDTVLQSQSCLIQTTLALQPVQSDQSKVNIENFSVRSTSGGLSSNYRLMSRV